MSGKKNSPGKPKQHCQKFHM